MAEPIAIFKVKQWRMNSATFSSAQRTSSASMKSIVMYLDFMSADASLAFERLPDALQGLSYSLSFKPVLLARWHQQASHSPHDVKLLSWLHLALACDAAGMPNRYVCERIFQHVRTHSQAASEAAAWVELSAQLAPVQDVASERVKEQLQAHTAEALALGVVAVPAFVVDGQVFSGLDSLPLLRR